MTLFAKPKGRGDCSRGPLHLLSTQTQVAGHLLGAGSPAWPLGLPHLSAWSLSCSLHCSCSPCSASLLTSAAFSRHSCSSSSFFLCCSSSSYEHRAKSGPQARSGLGWRGTRGLGSREGWLTGGIRDCQGLSQGHPTPGATNHHPA